MDIAKLKARLAELEASYAADIQNLKQKEGAIFAYREMIAAEESPPAEVKTE
jgi:hypothetical protein